MPPDRTSIGGPSKAKSNKPFKPPRPSNASTAAATSAASTSRTKSTSQTKHQSRADASSSSSSRPHPSISTSIDPYDIPNTSAVTVADGEADNEPRTRIPPELLTRLLHEFFTDDRMRISKGADRAVGKYMETFVREAIARAAFERESAGGVGAAVGGRFMEVEDLEKLAPQLVLDF